MTSPTPTPAAPPLPPAPDLTAPPLVRRMACWLYEGTLLFGVVFGTGLFFFGLVFVAGHLFPALVPLRDVFNTRYALQAYVFLLLALYFTWSWAKGQTLAQKTWNIRVVDRTGQPISRARAFGRYALSWIWLLPPLALGWWLEARGGALSVLVLGWVFIFALLSRLLVQRQFLHDALAATRLVHFEHPKKPQVRRP